MADQVGVGDQDPRRFVVGAKDAHRLADCTSNVSSFSSSRSDRTIALNAPSYARPDRSLRKQLAFPDSPRPRDQGCSSACQGSFLSHLLQLIWFPRGARIGFLLIIPLCAVEFASANRVRDPLYMGASTDLLKRGATARKAAKARSTPTPAFSGDGNPNLHLRRATRSQLHALHSRPRCQLQGGGHPHRNVILLPCQVGICDDRRWASTVASLRSATAATCGIMKPDCIPDFERGRRADLRSGPDSLGDRSGVR